MKYVDIEKFDRLDIKLDYKDIVRSYAKKAQDKLKANSPDDKRIQDRNNGKYKDTWAIQEKDGKSYFECKVWNAANWQLTHLLENGHVIVNKKNGVGWASAKPHIKPTYDSLKPKFVTAMTTDTEIKIK